MRFKAAVLSTTLASLLFATATLAAQESAPAGQQHPAGECRGGKDREGRMFHKLARMEHRLDRAVEKGRLTQAQADQFKAEARQLRDQVEAQRQSNGGQLTDAQRAELRQRKQALREKVKAAMKATAPQGV
jgi:FtsZ-binding cell division protein ZapB